MTDFRNSNGLVKGKIPAGKPCPFLEVCGSILIDAGRCPTKTKPKEIDFSCGLARAHSICIKNKEQIYD